MTSVPSSCLSLSIVFPHLAEMVSIFSVEVVRVLHNIYGFSYILYQTSVFDMTGVTGEEEGEEEDGSSVVGVSEQAVWLCTHCNLTFDNPSVLNLHTLTHAAQDLESAVVSGELLCPRVCKQRLSDGDFITYFLSAHAGLPSELTTVYHDGEFLVENGRVQCPQCAVQFPTKRELIDHVTAHGKLAAVTEADVGKQQQQPPTTYKCEHCYKSFATELRLQVSRVSNQPNLKSLKCELTLI